MLVLLALHADLTVIANRCRCRAPGTIGAHRRGSTLELFEVTARLGRRAIEVGRALRASSAYAARGSGRTIGVDRASRAAPSGDVADRLVGSAIGAPHALDTRAGAEIAELGPAIPALRVVGALRVALVIAGPARGGSRPAVRVVPTFLAAAGDAERIARPAVGVAEALHAAEGRVAFTSAARALGAREVPAATDERTALALAPARDDDDCSKREGNHPVLHGSYDSVPAR